MQIELYIFYSNYKKQNEHIFLTYSSINYAIQRQRKSEESFCLQPRWRSTYKRSFRTCRIPLHGSRATGCIGVCLHTCTSAIHVNTVRCSISRMHNITMQPQRVHRHFITRAYARLYIYIRVYIHVAMHVLRNVIENCLLPARYVVWQTWQTICQRKLTLTSFKLTLLISLKRWTIREFRNEKILPMLFLGKVSCWLSRI